LPGSTVDQLLREGDRRRQLLALALERDQELDDARRAWGRCQRCVGVLGGGRQVAVALRQVRELELCVA